ncbi:MAG: hypothetical protein GC152_08750 [Alphaproteobacteria bacterium]|nr:hypothetical protein [Alphaproteobacteria bacterium]
MTVALEPTCPRRIACGRTASRAAVIMARVRAAGFAAMLAVSLSACVAGKVVGGAASVAGKAAKTTVKAGGAAIDAGVDAVDEDYVPYPDCDDPDLDPGDPCTIRPPDAEEPTRQRR